MRRFASIFVGLFLWGVTSFASAGDAIVARVDIGVSADYPVGTVRPFSKEGFIVFSAPDGLYAVSTVCTHMGCHVSFKKEDGFLSCPCHGARFSREGQAIKGPARDPLSWYEISRDHAGRLYVDKTKKVKAGTMFSLADALKR